MSQRIFQKYFAKMTKKGLKSPYFVPIIKEYADFTLSHAYLGHTR